MKAMRTGQNQEQSSIKQEANQGNKKTKAQNKQRANEKERTPNEANRHKQSEVPTPTKTLTHGGCLNEARSAERVPPWVFKSDF